MIFLRWLTFLLGSLAVTLTVLLFWIHLFLLMLVFVLQWLPLQQEILMLLSQFKLTFHQTHNGKPYFIVGYAYSRADWDGLCIPLGDIFKLSASAAASEFVSGFM